MLTLSRKEVNVKILNKVKGQKPETESRPSPDLLPKERVSIHEQQVTTLPISYNVEFADGDLSLFFTEFHVTVQSKVEKLSRKQASILMSVLTFRAVHQGVDLILYLSLEWLFAFLVKSGHDYLEVKEEKSRQALMLAELILTTTRGSWLSLTDYESLPEEVVEKVLSTGWLPNERTFKSWENYWQPEKFLRARAVRVDTFKNNERNAQPYDSYTKGYGNGGNLSRVKRTPFSMELDGEEPRQSDPEFSLIELEQYNTVLLTIEEWKAKNRADRGQK